jgi:hypothetical protein
MIRTGKLSSLLLALVMLGAAAAHAESIEAEDTPDTDETEMTPVEPLFDEPVDLTVPTPSSTSPFDASRFTRGLPPPVWTSKAGIDNREGTPNAEVRPGHWLPGTTPEQAVGVAWANITAPGLMMWDRSAIETRIDPYQESRLGMTLSRSMPLSGDVALTLQNTFAWTQPLLHGAPVMAHGGHVVEGNHAVRFTYLPFDTTFSIGTTGSSAEDGWRRSLSAEQRLFGGPMSVTGAVSETGTGELDRSLKARFKRNW